MLLDIPGMSSFVLPFLFRDRERKLEFQRFITSEGIENRPLISGNLLRQPFLEEYYRPTRFPNADFLHFNAFYVGNNQFVNESRLEMLNSLMDNFFNGKE
jgi:CDP-6-deoxy-D-xylo-4-hexulose-3-dehydrase